MTFSIASPPGFEISGDVVAKAKSLAPKTEASLYFSHDPTEAVREADVIYTDVWTSMGQEAESQKRLEVFAPRYQINTALVSKAKRNAIVLHCLPAHRGQEITDDVADGRVRRWDQAENRMHAQSDLVGSWRWTADRFVTNRRRFPQDGARRYARSGTAAKANKPKRNKKGQVMLLWPAKRSRLSQVSVANDYHDLDLRLG
jgi:hypothetical protein